MNDGAEWTGQNKWHPNQRGFPARWSWWCWCLSTEFRLRSLHKFWSIISCLKWQAFYKDISDTFSTKDDRVLNLCQKISNVLQRDKMNRTVGFVRFFVTSSSLPWQLELRQQDWYISGTLRKQFPNLTVQFILSLRRLNITRTRGHFKYQHTY